MSANAWGGVLYRSQAKALVKNVAACFDEVELAPDSPEAYEFVALPKTKLTWACFVPLDAVAWEELVDHGLRLAKAVARATKGPAWFVANNDYSGIDVISVDAKGKKRWAAFEDGSWDHHVREQLEATLAAAKSSAEKKRTKQRADAELAKRWKKTPLGRLEAEAGLEWRTHISHLFGEVKRAAWRKRVKASPLEAPPPAVVQAPQLRADVPLVALSTTDLDHLAAVAKQRGVTPEALLALAFDRALPKLAKLPARTPLPVSSFANAAHHLELDETTARRSSVLASAREWTQDRVLGAAWLLEAHELAPDLPAPSFASYASLELGPWREWCSKEDMRLRKNAKRVVTRVKLARRTLLELEQRGAEKKCSLAEVIDSLSTQASSLRTVAALSGPTEDLELPLLKATVERLTKQGSLHAVVHALASVR